MQCPKCNFELPDGVTFCPVCGTVLEEEAVTQQVDAQEENQPDTSNEATEQKPQAEVEYGMKWYKFLINFALFASAVLNLISAIGYFTGLVYGDALIARDVYYNFPKLKTLDIIMGILFLGIAGLAVYTRITLAKFKKLGVILLLALYGVNALLTIVYPILIPSFAPELRGMNFFDTETISGLVVSIAMVFYNYKYFKTREKLFKD